MLKITEKVSRIDNLSENNIEGANQNFTMQTHMDDRILFNVLNQSKAWQYSPARIKLYRMKAARVAEEMEIFHPS